MRQNTAPVHLLRQAAPQAADVAPVPTPPEAAPSSLGLVHACLQRWLREGGPGDAAMGGAEPGLAAWGVDTPFSELGIDSLASVPLALEVEQASGVPVSAELLYDYPTVRLLAGYIDEQRDEQRDAQREEATALPASDASG